MALATLAYYRAPMLLMGALSTSGQTASYSVASNIGFGLLMLPAAIAAGLLPRLAGEPDDASRVSLIGRALTWSTGMLAVGACAVGAAAWWLVPALYGSAYRSARGPLTILLVTSLAIGAASVFGTALIAANRQREVVAQVVVALAVNLVACLVLIPMLAADGAALATLATELVSLAMLAAAYTRSRRLAVGPRLIGRPGGAAMVR
jgi:O-antigen/teichoic acid export membrane protein